jgi:hypothetical protein
LIVIFNGPPGAGKDEACLFFKQLGYKHLSFKEELFKETFKYFNVSSEWFMNDYNNRSVKEMPVEELKVDGVMLSRRDAMIYVSEKYIKPKFGSDYFGQQLSNHIDKDGNFSVSDGGFIEELTPIINRVGADNIILVQLTREGCDFSSDSRRYFNGNLVKEFVLDKETPISTEHVLTKKIPIRTYRVHNNGTVKEFHMALNSIHEKESNVEENKAKGNAY